MFPGRLRCHRLAIAALLSLLLSIAPLCDSQSSIVCPEGGRVEIVDGELEFGTLPPSSPPDREEYDAGGLEGWYGLARGFVNVVQSENLPYDVIERTINDNNLACGVRNDCDEQGLEEGQFEPQAVLEDFGKWWAPLIAVTVLGGLMSFIFLLVGCIFWCCRCCGNCGGGRSKRDPQDVCMFVTTILLLLVALLLLVGVVLSFYSNQQSYDSIDSLQDTVNTVISTAVSYMDTVLNEGDAILCNFIQVTEITLDETKRLNTSLNERIDEVGVDVNSVLERLDVLSSGINGTSDILTSVRDTTQELQSQSDALNSSLSNVAASISALVTDCNNTVGCNSIPSPETFTPGADFNQLPDVTQELMDVENSLEGINITRSIEEGNAEFDRVTGDIQSEVNTHLGGLDGGANSSGVSRSLSDANNTIFDNRDTVSGDIRKIIQNNFTLEDCPDLENLRVEDIDVNIGFVRQCYFNQIFGQYLQQYDVVRYAFGIIICCLALLTFVLTMLGIVFGVLGWRKDRSPNSRSKISHCGGIFLLTDVCLTFLFGGILLILASLAFFFGSNLQKICQSIEPPEYEFFTRVIDNTELWDGSLIGEIALGSGSILSISEALRACERDEALYTAFNLSRRFDVKEVLNRTQTFGELEQELNDTIDSFNYTSDSFLDNSTRSALNGFSDASVEDINITAFTVLLESDLLSFDLDSSVSTLQNLNETFTSAGQSELAAKTDDIIAQLLAINSSLPSIEMNVGLLTSQVEELSNHIDNVVVNTSSVVEEISGLVVNLTGREFRNDIRDIAVTSLRNIENYIDTFLNTTATRIEREVGKCRPLFIIYSEVYDFSCQEAVDGLNGFWWSLGFCAILFIPLIILAVCASTHYLRQNVFEDDAYSEYPMKSF